MEPEAYRYVMIASVAGGFTGALVMWHRKRTETVGPDRVRNSVALVTGIAAIALALFCFSQAFRLFPTVNAVLTTVLVTAGAAVVNSVAQLPLPAALFKVGPGEFSVLRSPWTGVKAFGVLLKKTFLKHLGGRVFLSQTCGDVGSVLRGIRSAEAVHVWALLISFPWIVLWLTQGKWKAVAWSCAVHVPLNVYPILHLRYVTRRVEWLSRREENPHR